jgi:DNA polymerase/3'-5' exonuclease PolX
MLLHEALLLRLSAAVGLSGCLVGSFRRGAADSGDIDVLLTYPPSTSLAAAQRLFHMYILALKAEVYVVDELVHGDKKWMGYVKLGSGARIRRLDLLLTPPEEYAYSMLYFTGSDKFNIAMRRHSLSKGYSLNEHGITPIATTAPLTREEDIFAFLGLRYVPPTERKDEAQIKKI